MLHIKVKSQDIISVLQKNVSARAAYIFLADGDTETARISFSELNRKARAIAAYLQSKKLTGERILLLYPAGLDFIAAFMGCLYAGAIAVPCACPRVEEFAKSRDLIVAIANDADIRGILTTEAYIEKIENQCTDIFATKDVFIGDPNNLDLDTAIMYQTFSAQPDTIAYLQYTSGSTAAPKGVVIRHKNLTHSLKYTAKVWRYNQNSVTCVWAPHSHVYGLICGLLVPLYHGTCSVIMPTEAFIKRPRAWLEAISKYKVTHSGCPNFGYDYCVREINDNELTSLNLSSWVVAVNGGEAALHETITRFTHKFSVCGFKLNHFVAAFGMSEVTGLIAGTPYKKAPIVFDLDREALKNNLVTFTHRAIPHRKMIGGGRLLTGLRAVIVDPETLMPVASNKIGEVWLSGASVASEYWRRAEETQAVFGTILPGHKGIFFRTGDLGFLMDGELCLTGRLKELLVIYGKKYYPLDIETTVAQALKTYPVTPYAAVFGISVGDKDEVILVQEIKETTTDETMDEIIRQCRRNVMSRHGIELYAVLLVTANTIPRTNSGKLQRQSCKKQFLAQQLKVVKQFVKDGSASATNVVEITTPEFVEKSFLQQLQNDFLTIIANVLAINVSQLKLAAPLSEYNFDSINIIKIANAFNETYKLHLTPAKLFEYTTFAEFFQDLLNQHSDALTAHYATPALTQAEEILPREEFNRPLTLEKQRNNQDYAVIGMSGMLPNAVDLESFWDNLISGRDGVSEVPTQRWHWQHFQAKSAMRWGGFVREIAEFDANFFNISPREAELIDPQQRILLQAVWKAIEDAGYATTVFSQLKTGLFVGAFSNDYAELLQKAGVTDAYATTGLSHSILANRISYLLNLQGPSAVIDTACSSSLVAIHNAVAAMQNGDCEVAIVAGVNALLTPTSYLTASNAGMLSEDGRCKTFDKKANGYVRGEGVGVIILKPLHHAEADNDHIYGILKGSAVNHGGHVSSLTVPNPNAQAEVISAAYERAHITPDTISYVETHGTGTPLGDPVEINGLKKAFSQSGSDKRRYCGLGAVKTHIGHLESAAGIAGVIKVLLAMQYGQIPGNLHFETLNPYIELNESPFYLVNETQSWVRLRDKNGHEIPRRAGVSSFGFGGTNAHVIFEEYKTKPIAANNLNKEPVLITLSAKTLPALKQRIEDLYLWLQRQIVLPSLSALSYTLNQGRNHFTKRCAVVVETPAELRETLEQYLQGNTLENIFIESEQNERPRNESVFNTLFKQLCIELKTSIPAVEYKKKLFSLAGFYTAGYDIDWNLIQKGERQRLALPTYPFAKDRYWLPNAQNIPFEQQQQAQVATPALLSTENFQDYIQQTAATLLKIDIENMAVDVALSELGFDSIAFKELATLLENHYGMTLTPTIFYTHKTIRALSEYLQENAVPQIAVRPMAQTVSSPSAPIAIIGMQGLLPQSRNLQEFWQHLVAGEDLISEIPLNRWDWRKYYGDSKHDPLKTNSKWGGLVADVDKFDAGFFKISAREANLMDPQQRLFMEVVWKTFEDAGYDPLHLPQNNVGLFAGVEFSEYQTLIHASKNLYHGHVATGNSHTMLTNRISYFLNLHGPSEVVDTACSSSLVAVHRAVNALRSGECAMAIAGGVSLMLNPETFIITSQLGALSPDGRCKTFDKSANGYVKGEGVVALLLKPLNQAQMDGDHIYGIIRSTTVNHGGKAQSLTAPDASAQSELIIKAYTQAEIDPATVTYIETHGTGTELGDPIEIEGLKQAFKTLLPENKNTFCGLGSVKTNIGHLEPASGIAGVIKVLLAMQAGEIPKNIHFNELNPYIDLNNSPFYLVTKNQPWRRIQSDKGQEVPRRAGVSSFGFGGTNAHIVLEESLQTLPNVAATKPYYLITLSAQQADGLQRKFIDLFTWLKHQAKTVNLEALSYTLNAGRTHFDARAAMVVESITELQQTLQQFIEGEQAENCIMQMQITSSNNSVVFTGMYKSAMETLAQDAKSSPQTYRKKLLVLADLYTKKFPVDWSLLHKDESQRRLAGLPNYPFSKQRYWFDAEMPGATLASMPVAIDATNLQTFTIRYLQNIFAEQLKMPVADVVSDKTYDVFGMDSLIGLETTKRLEHEFGSLPKGLLYEKDTLDLLAPFLLQKFPEKLQTLFTGVAQPLATDDEQWLIFSDNELGLVLQGEFGRDNCAYCFAGDSFADYGDHTYYINPEQADDYHQLMIRLNAQQKTKLKGVIYLWSYASSEVETVIDYKLHCALQALLQKNWPQKIRFCLVTGGVTGATEEEVKSSQRRLKTIARLFAAEQGHYEVLLLDLIGAKQLRSAAKIIAYENSHYQADKNHIVYQNGLRQVTHLQAPLQTTPWIAYRKKTAQPRTRLFCFPYAGGGASLYRDWQNQLGDTIEVCPIQFPGREERMGETCVTNMDDLVNQLSENLISELDLPFAFFGHSFGALVAFELTRHLRRESLATPIHLFVSAYPDPRNPTRSLTTLMQQLQAENIDLFALNQAQVIADLDNTQLNALFKVFGENGLSEYNNTTMNKEILEVLLPIFVADMQIVKSYQYREELALTMPITVFLGTQDKWIQPDSHYSWVRHTTNECKFNEFAGGHMFIKEEQYRQEMLATIQQEMLDKRQRVLQES